MKITPRKLLTAFGVVWILLMVIELLYLSREEVVEGDEDASAVYEEGELYSRHDAAEVVDSKAVEEEKSTPLRLPAEDYHASAMMEERVTKEEILEDWLQCPVIFFLHIARTGGTTFFTLMRTLKYPHIQIFTHFGSEEHARKATNRASKHLREKDRAEDPLVISIETMYPLLESAGYDAVAEDTCFVATVRDPSSWIRSATGHARFYWKQAGSFADYEYFTRVQNAQTSFFHGIWKARSLAIVDFHHQDELEWLVYELLKSKGYEDIPKAAKKVGAKQKTNMIDWEEWVDINNPLDRALHSVTSTHELSYFRFASDSNGERYSTTMPLTYSKWREVVEQFKWEEPKVTMEEYLAVRGYDKQIQLIVDEEGEEVR